MKTSIMTSVLLVSLCLITAGLAHAFNIYRVGELIKGREHNDMLKSWLDRNFSIWVGIDKNGKEYVLFKGETGLTEAKVMLRNSKKLRDKLEKAVSKAIEWSGVAIKNKADTTKGLGCFGSDEYNICEKNSQAFEEGQMSFKFFAANGGQQTDLIIDIIDNDNQFYKASIYINEIEMKKLLNVIRGIENKFTKARKTHKNEELFK